MYERSSSWLGCKQAAAVALAFVLAGCGGGGDSSSEGSGSTPSLATGGCVPSNPGPEGLFGATLSPTNEFMVLIARQDGTHAGFIGRETGTAFVPSEAFRLRTSCQVGDGARGRAFLYPQGPDALVSIAVDSSAPSISGDLRISSLVRTISGGRVPGTSYNFDQPASVSTATGSLLEIRPDRASMTILADGSVTGTYLQCRVAGHVTPRADGKNILDLALTIDVGTCPTPTTTDLSRLDGFVVAYGLANGGIRSFAYLYGSTDLNFGSGDQLLLTGSQP
jgi:hypothetical protein